MSAEFFVQTELLDTTCRNSIPYADALMLIVSNVEPTSDLDAAKCPQPPMRLNTSAEFKRLSVCRSSVRTRNLPQIPPRLPRPRLRAHRADRIRNIRCANASESRLSMPLFGFLCRAQLKPSAST